MTMITDKPELVNGAANPGGRPKSENPSAKTLANRESQGRRETADIGAALDLPSHLRFDALAVNDAARIMEYARGELARFESESGALCFADERGIWNPAQTAWTINAAQNWRRFIDGALTDARDMALNEIAANGEIAWHDGEQKERYMKAFETMKPAGNRHLRETADTLINMAADIPITARTDEHNISREPLIPINSGGAWLVADCEYVDRDELMGMKIIGLDMAMDYPNLAAWENPPTEQHRRSREIYEIRYGKSFLQRIALGALGADKRMELVKAAKPNFGKSTFFAALHNAFGSCVSTIGYKELAGISGRFTPIHKALATSLWAVADECDKAGFVNPAHLGELVNDILSVELKGMNPKEMRRIATLYFVGNDWLATDSGAAGIPERFEWAHEFHGADEMTENDSNLLRGKEAGETLQAGILIMAANLVRENPNAPDYFTPLAKAKGNTVTDESREARAAFIEQNATMPMQALTASVYPDMNGFVSNAEIDAIFEEWEIEQSERPKTKALAALMRRFDGRPTKRRRQRGYAGISRKENGDD